MSYTLLRFTYRSPAGVVLNFCLNSLARWRNPTVLASNALTRWDHVIGQHPFPFRSSLRTAVNFSVESPLDVLSGSRTRSFSLRWRPKKYHFSLASQKSSKMSSRSSMFKCSSRIPLESPVIAIRKPNHNMNASTEFLQLQLCLWSSTFHKKTLSSDLQLVPCTTQQHMIKKRLWFLRPWLPTCHLVWHIATLSMRCYARLCRGSHVWEQTMNMHDTTPMTKVCTTNSKLTMERNTLVKY